VYAGVTSMLAWLVRGGSTAEQPIWLWFLHARSLFQTGILGEVGFMPHFLIAATAFAVCLVLVTRRVEADPDADELVVQWSRG
jgi:hypothetical protein